MRTVSISLLLSSPFSSLDVTPGSSMLRFPSEDSGTLRTRGHVASSRLKMTEHRTLTRDPSAPSPRGPSREERVRKREEKRMRDTERKSHGPRVCYRPRERWSTDLLDSASSAPLTPYFQLADGAIKRRETNGAANRRPILLPVRLARANLRIAFVAPP